MGYQDAAWLDSMARQHQMAFEAYSNTLEEASKDLASRLAREVEAVGRALCLDRRVTEDPTRPWLAEAIALNRAVRTLMGESYWRLDERIALLSRAADDCAEEIARAKNWKTEDCADTLCSYQCDRRDGYAGTFSAWLAEQKEIEKSPGGSVIPLKPSPVESPAD